MSERERIDPALEDALRRMPRPAADADFRARSRAAFVGAAPAAEPRTVPTPQMPTPRVSPRTRAFPLVWPLVLAASIALLIVFVLRRDTANRWSVVDAPAGARYVVDELPVGADERERLVDLLQTARRIETGPAGLRVRLADQLVLELGPDTIVSQLRFPAAGMYSMRADRGSVRVCTGPDFPGESLRLLTDHLESNVVGTVFGVDVEPQGTCLCCIEGVVRCDARDGAGSKKVEAGGMCFAFPNQAPAKRGPALPAHVAPLEALQRDARALWSR